jgi:hypothetical protein
MAQDGRKLSDMHAASPPTLSVEDVTHCAACTAIDQTPKAATQRPDCVYIPNPDRGAKLRVDIYSAVQKGRREAAKGIKCNDDYLQAVHKSAIQPFMRRMVFEWNLEVRVVRYSMILLDSASEQDSSE